MCSALRGGEECEGGGVRVEVVLVGLEVGRLGQLGRQGVDHLGHAAGGRVVRLAEVVRHHSVPGLNHNILRPEAAGLDESEEGGSLAGARGSLYQEVSL